MYNNILFKTLMYKIFVNNKPLFLTNVVEHETDFKLFLLESVNIKDIVIKLYTNKINKCYLYHPDKKMMLEILKSKIPNEKAAGGLVTNDKREVLMIFRNGKWDLPKGGKEKGEKMSEAGMREVQEETGVKGLKILKKLPKTFHIFKRNGRYKLKITRWYWMHSNYNQSFNPQLEEGIEEVKWVSLEHIECFLGHSYENIKLVFEAVIPFLENLSTSND